MSDAGIPLRHIQAISGHRTLSALERYLGVTEKQKQNAIASLDFSV
jgi:integrase/recombinase XerD